MTIEDLHLRNDTIVFSEEIFHLIGDFLFEPTSPINTKDSVPQTICCAKPKWSDIHGFVMVNSTLRKIGMARWTRVLTVRTFEDWNQVLYYSHWVRELRCLDGAFAAPYSTILLQFQRLYTVSVDAHSDVISDVAGRFAYCDLITALPGSVRRLEIQHAHGPDIKIIQLAEKHCPLLEELRLGRCTMFNRHPACPFWERFNFDHDAYMSLEGADEYAHSLAKELSPMKHLTVLQLGVYLIPSTLVLIHRLFHVQDRPVPTHFGWQDALNALAHETQGDTPATHLSILIALLHQPPENFSENTCHLCWDITFQASINAEESANLILQQGVPSLKRVAWMSWFSSGHLGLSYGPRSK
ncbi:hypothetical protein FRC12_016353 [Ceratobasidium sp. 428]|nr:hypothetical protein FRC12_016353 [Ceratobasidium sp. 428]